MSACEECGSRLVEIRPVEGVDVEVCGLCGVLRGDGEEVRLAREREEARERGFHPAVYPLVKVLERVPTFRVASASAGRADRSEYAFVFLRVEAGGLKDIERLLTSIEMANRTTKRRWVLECALQRGLLFILRPRFWKAVLDINAEDIEESRADLSVLASILDRDTALGWWTG